MNRKDSRHVRLSLRSSLKSTGAQKWDRIPGKHRSMAMLKSRNSQPASQHTDHIAHQPQMWHCWRCVQVWFAVIPTGDPLRSPLFCLLSGNCGASSHGWYNFPALIHFFRSRLIVQKGGSLSGPLFLCLKNTNFVVFQFHQAERSPAPVRAHIQYSWLDLCISGWVAAVCRQPD